MPIHDWIRVEAGVYHHFHLQWIASINNLLNGGLLPPDYYALAEQVAAGFGPDVFTLQDRQTKLISNTGGTATQVRPKSTYYAALSKARQLRRKSLIAVRHISGDRVVAMIEIVSPSNKNSTNAFNSFVTKAVDVIDRRIHLLILDPFPPGPNDPGGIHSAIWEQLAAEPTSLPVHPPLTMVSYEADDLARAYIEVLNVGDQLPDMPLFLAPEQHIMLPLEATYQAAWENVPMRWQRVVAGME